MAAASQRTQAEGQPSSAAARRGGALVVLEGIDGSGKSSLAQALHARLEERGIQAVLTREPTDSWLGAAVKRSLREASDPFVEAFLFLADHADHVRRVEQWVALGKVVVSDRYGDSCLAYQAATLEPVLRAREVDALAWLRAAQEPVHRPPELTLLLDLEPEAAVERLHARKERAKYEDAGFLVRVRRNYQRLAEGPSYEVLDATKPPEALLEAAWKAMARRNLVPA